jgi:hypothetical protein
MEQQWIGGPSGLDVAPRHDNPALRIGGDIVVIIQKFLNTQMASLTRLEKHVPVLRLADTFEHEDEVLVGWML